ncbi:MAG TPA: BatA domain-containing protein, partial [Verrucomicrobiales bacterium]|nr:BatA domain-containing protein [Verrucomicrobiales bacterium]
MQFLSPAFLYLGFLALIPVALYLFRRKARVKQVSTLVFFKTLAREHQESAWLRRVKRILSLLMTLMILWGAVLALSRVAFTPRTDEFRTVVVLLDRSASMAARDAEGGPSRLDLAKARILT